MSRSVRFLQTSPAISDEVRYRTQRTGEGNRRVHLRPKKMRDKLLCSVVHNYTNPGEMLLAFCTGTFRTGRACLQIHAQRYSILCNADSTCLSIATANSVSEFSTAILNDSSDIRGADAVQEHGHVYIKVGGWQIAWLYFNQHGCPPDL